MSDLMLKKPDYLANVNPMDNVCPIEMEDVKVPILVLAQVASKALQESDPGYIIGLKAGQFYNSVTREIYDKSLKLQFIHYFKTYQVFEGKQNGEWKEALSEDEFKRLRNVQFDKINGFLSPDKPDSYIKENWRFVVSVIGDDSFDFVFMNVKPGGIGEAKFWVNQMFAKFQKGELVNAIIWEVSSYMKESKTSNASSFQIEGSKIRAVGYVDQSQYEKAVKIKDDIKMSQANHIVTGEEY